MKRLGRKFVSLAPLLAMGGACFQLGGCDVVGLAGSAISSINPCGTILACDPREYQFWTSGIDGPGYTDKDPWCVFAPFCGPEDPLFGGLLTP